MQGPIAEPSPDPPPGAGEARRSHITGFGQFLSSLRARVRSAQNSPAGRKLRVASPFLTALVLTLTFLTLPRHPFLLDDSFSEKVVLSYANEHGLRFGTDIIFTYGPLGFLTGRYFFPHAADLRVVFDVLVCFVTAAGVCLIACRFSAIWKWLLLRVF